MTKLIVTPIDPNAPGSWRQRNEFFRLGRSIKAARDANDNIGLAAAMADFADYLQSRLRTDDSSPVDEILDRMSINEVEELMKALGNEIDAVSPTTASS